MTNSIITNNGKKILIYRSYTENGDLAADEYLAPTEFKVGITNPAPDVTDNDLSDPVDITAGVQTKSFVTGYPSLDFNKLQVTIRAYLNSLEANGNDLNAIGIFNEDSSPLMHSIDVFSEESKSDTDEFAFILRDRVI